MVPPRRHLRARALAPLAALTLAACGCGDGGGSSTVAPPKPTKSLLAAWHALERAPCPAPYLAIDQKTSYSRAELRQAEKGRFSIKGHPTTLEPSIDWAMDPYDSKSFRGVLASLKWIDPVIYASRHGDRQALAQARDIALDWVAHNPRHHPPTDKSWENKIIGDRAPYLAYITRAAACQHMLSSEQGLTLIESLRQHGRALTENKLYVPSNHGLFMDYGLEALAKEAAFLSKAHEWERFAPKRFQKTLERRIYPSEGFWLENSSSYHLAVLKLVREFTGLAGNAAPPSLRQITRRMTDVAGWLIEPDGKRVLLGDSNLKPTPPEASAAARDDGGMLFLRRSGIGAVKSRPPDSAYLLFAATFQNGTHNQADALTLDLFDRGQRILSDSGLYDKEDDPWQVYSRAAYSHSVMTIDGKTFPLDKKFRYGSGLRASGQGDGWFAMEGVNPNARAGAGRAAYAARPLQAALRADRRRLGALEAGPHLSAPLPARKGREGHEGGQLDVEASRQARIPGRAQLDGHRPGQGVALDGAEGSRARLALSALPRQGAAHHRTVHRPRQERRRGGDLLAGEGGTRGGDA